MSEPTAAERFDAAMEAIEAPVTAVIQAQRRYRIAMWGLAGSLAFDICLSVVLGLVAVHANNAANLANSVNKAALSACHSRNDFKALDLQRWTTIVNQFASPPAHQTAEQKATAAKNTAKFITYISLADAPEKC